VVVDPAFAIEQYVDEAARNEVKLVGVLETHTHADHLSGHGRLALDHGCAVHIHPAAEPEYAHEPLEDGATVELGDVSIRAIHTPGHRPEHCALAVTDRSRGDEPWLVLTGDSLFVGDAARPDLAVEAAEGAEGLFHSLRRLAELGDGVEVYPGHVAGSLCGANLSSKSSTTIGFERRFNQALVETYDEFMGKASGPQPPRPPNMEMIVELNRGPFLGAQPPLRQVEDGGSAVLLDVRDRHAYAAGHSAGAINVPLFGTSFGTKSAFVLPERPIVLESANERDALLAAERLHAVGIFDLAGWREPGADEALPSIAVDELERALANEEVQLIDVREKDERDHGFIPGSTHLPYRSVRQAAENGLCGERPIVTICESGARAAVAASVLQSVGLDARPVLDGGIASWPGETYSFRRCGGS